MDRAGHFALADRMDAAAGHRNDRAPLRLAACRACRHFGYTRLDRTRCSSWRGYDLGPCRIYHRDRVVRRLDISDRRDGAVVVRRCVALSEWAADHMDARELVA